VEGLAISRGEEPGDVAQSWEGTVHVTPFPKREHLMDPDTRQPLRVSLYGVEDRGRLTVRHILYRKDRGTERVGRVFCGYLTDRVWRYRSDDG
jgi:hypothetical protein